jgi:hypothetical protein
MNGHETSSDWRSQTNAAARFGAVLLHGVWRACVTLLRYLIEPLFALILLFEEWGWRPLAELLGRLNRWQLWRLLEGIIATLPPYAALAVFVLPTTLLLPMKLFALVLITTGHKLVAGALLLTAKVAGTALLARIFELTQPALMQIGWFAKTYRLFLPWKNAIHARIRLSWVWRQCRMIKARVRDTAARTLARWWPKAGRLAARVHD